MTAYINELILTVIVCQTASMLAPDSDTAKRYLRIVCALVTLLTIVAPVRTIISHADELGDKFSRFFTADETVKESNESLESAAYTILTYANERYSFDTEGAEITFFKDETGKIDEMMLFFPSGNAFDRERLLADLVKEFGVDVHIFLERRIEGG